MKKITFTKTSTFIFPLLNIPRDLFKYKLINFGKNVESTRFVNSYIYNSQNQLFNDHVSIVISNYRDKDFDDFYNNIKNLNNFHDEYISNNTLVLIFKIPEENIKDYNIIKQGKYSEISEKGKSLILSNFFFDFKPSTIPMILNKAPFLKNSWEKVIGSSIENGEVWSILNEIEETLTIEKLNGSIKLKPSKDFE